MYLLGMNRRAMVLGWMVLVVWLGTGVRVQAQRRNLIPFALHIGGTLAPVQGQGSTTPGLALALQAGWGTEWKQRFGIMATAGISLLEHSLSIRSLQGIQEYSVTVWNPEAMLLPYVNIPMKRNPHSMVHLGLGLGGYFCAQATSGKLAPDFVATAQNPRLTLGFLQPEIGLRKAGSRTDIHLALTFVLRDGARPLLDLHAQSSIAAARLQSQLQYAGLIVRFVPYYNARKNPIPVVPFEKPREKAPKPAMARSEEAELSPASERHFRVSRETVVMEFWDQGEPDGDTISVFLNGQPVLLHHALSRTHERVELRLASGPNVVELRAESEGSIKPNTARCIVRSGRKTYRFEQVSRMGHSAMINLEYTL